MWDWIRKFHTDCVTLKRSVSRLWLVAARVQDIKILSWNQSYLSNFISFASRFLREKPDQEIFKKSCTSEQKARIMLWFLYIEHWLLTNPKKKYMLVIFVTKLRSTVHCLFVKLTSFLILAFDGKLSIKGTIFFDRLLSLLSSISSVSSSSSLPWLQSTWEEDKIKDMT